MKENETPSDQLTLFAEVFLVSRFQQQESETEQAMIATYGRKCLESFEKLNQPGLLEKTLLVSCRWTAGLYSSRYALRWKMKATPYKRLYFQLFPSERRTEETEFGLLRTPTAAEAKDQSCSSQVYIQDQLKAASSLLLTPGVVMHEEHPDSYKKRTQEKNYNRGNEWTSMAAQVRYMDTLLGTPTSRDWKDTGDLANVPTNGLLGRQIGKTTGMKLRLQPAMTEWMMGFPLNWTSMETETIEQSDSKPSETP